VVAPAPTPVPAALPAKPSAAPQPLAARDVRSAKTRKREARKAGTSARPSSPPARESAKRAPDIDDILVAKSPSAEKSPEKKSDATKGDSETGKSTGNPLDDLLLGALNGKKAAPKSADEPEAGGGLPQTPSRDQMMSVLGKAKAKVSKCKGTGVATANITIAGSGRVSNVAVAGVDGSAKSCVETAVRSTAFPKFQKDSFAVKFAFKLGGS
jgi:hypothetical protein